MNLTGAKRIISVVLLAMGLVPLGARLDAGATRNNRFGLGLAIDTSLWPLLNGAGASLSGKLWFDGIHALDMSLGGNNYGVGLGADYLWHTAKAFQRRDIPLYYGIGGYVNLYGGYLGAGVRGKIGVDWLFPGTPWEAYVEASPALNLLGGIGFGAGLSGGFRYYF